MTLSNWRGARGRATLDALGIHFEANILTVIGLLIAVASKCAGAIGRASLEDDPWASEGTPQ